MKLYKYSALILIALFITSCEDVIDVDANFQESKLVIDAWINNNPESQTIRLTKSQNYFDSTFAQTVTGADIKVIKNSIEEFIFSDMGDGNYIWVPDSSNDRLGEVGDVFSLEVNYDGDEYQAQTQLNRTAIIDSLQIFFQEEEELGYDTIGYYGSLYARDHVGTGDAYWIKGFTNDTLHNKPIEISLSYDGTFDPGSIFDGLGFIRPIRESVNRVSDDNLFLPLQIGDKVRAEVHSISVEAFSYLTIIQEQLNNGENTIFALPLANANGNITNTSTDEKALGFFNVAAVASIEEVVVE